MLRPQAMAKNSKKKRKAKVKNSQASSSQHDQIQKQVLAEVHSHSGPLPPPAILDQYDQVAPGTAERIISMAENQMLHRQEIEKQVISSEIEDSKRGLHYGLLIGLVAVIGGTTCIALGKQVGGSIIGGTGLTGLVGVFVYGSRQRRKEREIKYKAQG
jgi:uncharacterized membrane protein